MNMNYEKNHDATFKMTSLIIFQWCCFQLLLLQTDSFDVVNGLAVKFVLLLFTTAFLLAMVCLLIGVPFFKLVPLKDWRFVTSFFLSFFVVLVGINAPVDSAWPKMDMAVTMILAFFINHLFVTGLSDAP